MNGTTIQQYPVMNDFLSKEEVDLLKRSLLAQFDDDEKMTFIRVCQRTRLDPFTKQVYATRRYTKVRDADGGTIKKPTLVPVTGIMGLCAVAERTGHYDGCEIYWSGPEGEWKTEWLAEDYPAAAKCIVYHKTRKHPEIAIARWFSYVGQTYNYQTKQWEVGDFWNKMPDWMLAKCAKAAALRGAFPDQLSNVYIREELDSNITDTEETESIPADEVKIAENQRRTEEAITHPPKGVTIVEQKKEGVKKPTPAEALEPAFEEDKIPEKPTKAPPPPPAAEAAAARKEKPDELDMTPVAPQASPEPTAPPEPKPPIDLSWRAHVIKSISHPKFENKKIGDLSAAQLAVIETQWLPQVLEQWEDATDVQRGDADAFRAAIAFQKDQKPW